MLNTLKKAASIREFNLFVIIVVFMIVMPFFAPQFTSSGNIMAMLISLSVEGLVVIGMVILLISGGLDLSVGSTMAFSGVMVGLALKSGMPVPIAIGLALLSAVCVGCVNGFLVAKVGLNPFITTLGTMMAIKGLMLVFAGGKAVLNMPDSFKNLGQGSISGIQYPIIFLIIVVILMDVLVRNSRFMRQSYYVGGNEHSSFLNGINVNKVKMINYGICALFAGLAGIILTARFGSASVTIGEGTAMNVITAAIIGGASLNGGEGSVFGAFLGALFMQMLSSALNLLSVDIYWQNFITGFILIMAILIDALNERRVAKNPKQSDNPPPVKGELI